MNPLCCPDWRCVGQLTQHPDIEWANICTHCQKGWAILDGQWVEIFPETELDEVVHQARKLVNT